MLCSTNKKEIYDPTLASSGASLVCARAINRGYGITHMVLEKPSLKHRLVSPGYVLTPSTFNTVDAIVLRRYRACPRRRDRYPA
jgi:hypothetical protein